MGKKVDEIRARVGSESKTQEVGGQENEGKQRGKAAMGGQGQGVDQVQARK